MTHLILSPAMQALIGLVPYGEIEPQVYGLQPLYRRQQSWVFRVVERWRLEVVRETLANTLAVRGAQTQGALLGRLGSPFPIREYLYPLGECMR